MFIWCIYKTMVLKCYFIYNIFTLGDVVIHIFIILHSYYVVQYVLVTKNVLRNSVYYLNLIKSNIMLESPVKVIQYYRL